MLFKIDPAFEHYWPPLPDEKFIILEKSILEEGIRENLVVWKEKNILLDGHQRFVICKKHGIPIDKKITHLSFPDEIHAKHWVHITQAARRGDAPQFLSICHVLEFEPIYREEAKQRKIRKPKNLSCVIDAGQKEYGGTAPGKHCCPLTLIRQAGARVLVRPGGDRLTWANLERNFFEENEK